MEDTQRLIEQIKLNQSSAAVRSLVNKYQARVFTFCLRMVRNREVAEELAQDSFLKALKNINKLNDPNKFQQWLMKLTYHITIDYIRRKRIDFDPIETAGDITSSDDPHYDLVNKDRRQKIEEVIGKFQPEDRAVLTLYYLEDQSVKQIEVITGLSQSNIKVKLFRAREALRTEFQKISNLL